MWWRPRNSGSAWQVAQVPGRFFFATGERGSEAGRIPWPCPWQDTQPGVSGRLILGAVLDANPALPVVYLPRRTDVVQHALRLARPGDVVLTLGAGDLTTVPDEWLMRAVS